MGSAVSLVVRVVHRWCGGFPGYSGDRFACDFLEVVELISGDGLEPIDCQDSFDCLFHCSIGSPLVAVKELA